KIFSVHSDRPGIGEAPSGTCSSFLPPLSLAGSRSLRKAASRMIVPGTMSLPAIDDFSGSINPVSSDAGGEVDGGRGIELDIRILELGLEARKLRRRDHEL